MFVLKSFIILAVGMYSSSVSAGCKFSNDDALKDEPTFGDYNVDQGAGFKWKNVNGKTTVPYIFENVDRNTQAAYKKVMKELERGSRSCIRFKQTTNTNQKYLKITDGTPCYTGGAIGGEVKTKWSSWKPEGEQTLDMDHRLCSANPRGLERYLGVVRHEFLHVFGLQHTQTRQDRDEYIRVNYRNLLNDGKSQYEKCRNCKTFGAPYECNSIMHYGANDFAINWRTPTMTPVDKNTCKINPGTNLTNWDWKLLRKAANCPGS